MYDQATIEGSLFAQYMNTLMNIKMEASGYPVVCAHEGIYLCYDDIVYNAGRRIVAKLCLNNIWGKYAQNPDRCMKEFVTRPRKFFELISDATYDVSDV